MTSSLTHFLPAVAGGVLIGMAAGGLRLFAGRTAGISGIVHTALHGPERGWRLAFLAGLLVAGFIAPGAFGVPLAQGLKQAGLPLLALAGLLVGVGTGLARGCTSGHGICGLASFSRRSLAAVLCFMVTAMLTVYLTRHGMIEWAWLR